MKQLRPDAGFGRVIEVEASEWSEHRLYVSELIELRTDVSIIILLPAAHNICSAPGHVDLRHVATVLPLQIFEISKRASELRPLNCGECFFQHISLECFHTVGWATGRAAQIPRVRFCEIWPNLD